LDAEFAGEGKPVRAGQKALSLRTVGSRDGKTTSTLCAEEHVWCANIDARMFVNDPERR
jgi:hypothetical protein